MTESYIDTITTILGHTHQLYSGSDQIVSINNYDIIIILLSIALIIYILSINSGLAKVDHLTSVSTTFYLIGELSGQISVIHNSKVHHRASYYDLDNDGMAITDSVDDFPTDPTQQTDSDGDGYGDNVEGVNGDLFPNNPDQHEDSDGDGESR